MDYRKIAIFAAARFAAGLVDPRAGFGQTFQSYRCADGTQFIVGFFQYDSRAHLQLDGKAVTLARRLALSGRGIREAASPSGSQRPVAPPSSTPNGR